MRQPPGRQVQLHYHEDVLQKARAEQKTPEHKRVLREKLRPRAKVERKISEVLKLHGLRQGRHSGQEKTELQAQMKGGDGQRQEVVHAECGRREACGGAARGATGRLSASWEPGCLERERWRLAPRLTSIKSAAS